MIKMTPRTFFLRDVIMFWDFVGAVASIKQLLETTFDFKWDELKRSPVIVDKRMSHIDFPIAGKDFNYCFEDNDPSFPPRFFERVESETILLRDIALNWCDGVIYCRVGYGVKTGVFVRSEPYKPYEPVYPFGLL